MSYKPYIIFTILISIGLSTIFVVSSGYYPILSVNGHFVMVKTFWKNYRAGSIYYNGLLKTYPEQIGGDQEISKVDIERSVLTQLIENKIVELRVKEELGAELGEIVSKKIESYSENAELKKAAQTVYGLSFDDFKKEILIPMANQEILAGRLFLDGNKIGAWLNSAKKESRIKIFSGSFYWDGQEVQVKKN